MLNPESSFSFRKIYICWGWITYEGISFCYKSIIDKEFCSLSCLICIYICLESNSISASCIYVNTRPYVIEYSINRILFIPRWFIYSNTSHIHKRTPIRISILSNIWSRILYSSDFFRCCWVLCWRPKNKLSSVAIKTIKSSLIRSNNDISIIIIRMFFHLNNSLTLSSKSDVRIRLRSRTTSTRYSNGFCYVSFFILKCCLFPYFTTDFNVTNCFTIAPW